MFNVRVNRTYIGRMTLTAAHIIMKAMCSKVGDVVEFTTDCDDDSYYMSDDSFETHTFYHNGTEVISFIEVCHYNYNSADEGRSSHLSPRLHTSAYSKRLTGFKYNRSDARRGGMKQEQLSYIKRDMRRTERRVGKLITQYCMSDEV